MHVMSLSSHHQARENLARLQEQEEFDIIDKRCWKENMLLAVDRLNRDVAKLKSNLDCSDSRNEQPQGDAAREVHQPEMRAERSELVSDLGQRYSCMHGKLYIKQYVLKPRLEGMLKSVGIPLIE